MTARLFQTARAITWAITIALIVRRCLRFDGCLMSVQMQSDGQPERDKLVSCLRATDMSVRATKQSSKLLQKVHGRRLGAVGRGMPGAAKPARGTTFPDRESSPWRDGRNSLKGNIILDWSGRHCLHRLQRRWHRQSGVRHFRRHPAWPDRLFQRQRVERHRLGRYQRKRMVVDRIGRYRSGHDHHARQHRRHRLWSDHKQPGNGRSPNRRPWHQPRPRLQR